MSAQPRSALSRLDSRLEDRLRSTTERELRSAFDKMAHGRSSNNLAELTIREKDFVHACTEELKLEMSSEEVVRLFHRLDEENKGSFDYEQFRRAVKRSFFLTSIISNYDKEIKFTVPPDYDYEVATCEQYCHRDYVRENGDSPWEQDGRSSVSEWSQQEHGPLYGKYRNIRRMCDYSYHVNYSEERQLWQDQLLANVVVRAAPQPRPWLVFTCGAMGSGKGYALGWLSKHGLFPLEKVCHLWGVLDW